MLGKTTNWSGFLALILFLSFGFSQVVLEIKNVNIQAGTLDIHMSNNAGCSYCPDPQFNNNSQPWVGKENNCNLFTDTTWTAYDQITEAECSAIPGYVDSNGDALQGGWWFDGSIGGFQFDLLGINIIDASNPYTDIIDFKIDNSATSVIGFSLTAATIPPGDGLLTQVTFDNFDGNKICFGEDLLSNDANTLSNSSGGYVDTSWGQCYCAADADSDGVCDDVDTCSGGDDKIDLDSDGVVDGCDACLGTGAGENVDEQGCSDYQCAADADADGICDDSDLCSGYDDAVDADNDTVPDGCDTCADTNANAEVDLVPTSDTYGCSIDQLSINQISSSLPSNFSISQNYPNPFNPVTSITFSVATMDEISLVVYDLLGKEVANLVSGSYAPGIYTVEWDAINNFGEDISSGMYVYQYISSEKIITRKMLYLK